MPNPQFTEALANLNQCDASAPQRAYMLAKAAFETADETADAEIKALTIPKPTHAELQACATCEEMDALPYFAAMDAITKRYNVDKFRDFYREACNCLVEWAQDESKRNLPQSDYARIKAVFVKWPELTGKHRADLLDICFRMPSGNKTRAGGNRASGNRAGGNRAVANA